MSGPRFGQLIEQMLGDGYRCAGAYDGDELIAICGFWMRSQFFCGRHIEPDNLVLKNSYRSQGIGRMLIDWVEHFGKEEGCETGWLKTYVGNTDSHKFYYNAGYKMVGLGFMKELA